MLNQAKYLTAAVLLEYGLQLVLPIYLVRALAAEDFASYRFLGLLLSTSTVVLAAGVPGSLSYFLPRQAGREQAAYVGQTAVFSLTMGLVAALLLALALGLLPQAGPLALVPSAHLPVYALLALQFAALPLDNAPIARNDIRGQALVNALSAVVRVMAVVCGAAVGTVEAVCWAMVVFASARVLAMGFYVARVWAWRDTLGLRLTRLKDQLGYALPFGLGNAFYALRGQAEQWIAAGMLSVTDYASVSIAAVLSPLVIMLRVSVSRSVVPTLQKLAHEERHDEMLALNSRSNIIASAMLVPLIAFVFAFADVLVVQIYTERYAAAADVMRVICIGLLAYGVEFSSINRCFRIGRKVATFDGALLACSIVVSLVLAHFIGLQGAVAGSALGLFLGGAFGAHLTSKQMRRPIAQLQDWRAIGGYLLAGAAAAVLPQAVYGRLHVDHTMLTSAFAAVPVFALVYVGVLRLTGQALWPDRKSAPAPLHRGPEPEAGQDTGVGRLGDPVTTIM